MDEIAALSKIDKPELFGLNENVNTLYHNTITSSMMNSLKMVLPKIQTDLIFYQ